MRQIMPTDLAFENDLRTSLSNEQIGLLTGETILVIPTVQDTDAFLTQFASTNPLWARLPAVQAARVHPLSFEH